MSEVPRNSLPLTIPAGPGKTKMTRAKHGIHSWVDSKRLPKGRAFAKTRRELGQLRTALIDRRGGDGKITPEELILVDSAIEALGVQKLLGLYVKSYGIVDGQSAKRGRLELSPILGRSWVAYANVVRQALLALETLKRDGRDQVPTLAEVIRECDEAEAKAKEAANGGPSLGQGGRSAVDQGNGEGAGTPAQDQGEEEIVATDATGVPSTAKDGQARKEMSDGDE